MAAVELLTIGNELLNGHTVNTNAAWLGRELNTLGLSLQRVLTIPDEAAVMAAETRAALQRAEVVLLTGGLGATRDDITKTVLNDLFGGGELLLHPDTLAQLEAYMATRGKTVNTLLKQNAYIPPKSRPLLNGVGAAPGLHFTTQDGRHVFATPGVPWEMEHLYTRHILPFLKEHYQQDVVEHYTLCTAGIPESSAAKRLHQLEQRLPPEIALAYNPSLHSLKLRLSLQGPRNRVEPLLPTYRELCTELRSRLQEHAYGEDGDTLEEVTGRLLQQQGKFLATAESCTGGALMAQMVTVPGASAYIKGAQVTYHNSIKQELGVDAETLRQHGAVSEPVAIQMAQHIRQRLGADVALSTTGVAGPGGGSAKKPVGQVWIGYADAGKAYARRFQFERDRQRNIQRTVTTALYMLWLELSGTPPPWAED